MSELSRDELVTRIQALLKHLDDFVTEDHAYYRETCDIEAARRAAAYEYCADKLREVLGLAPKYE